MYYKLVFIFILNLALAATLQAEPLTFEQAPMSVLIADEVEFFIDQQNYDSNYPVQYKIKKTDHLLKLKRCKQSLQSEFINPEKKTGNTYIRVKCHDPFWQVSLPVYITVYKDVLALKRPLPQNSIITPDAVHKVKKDVSQLGKGFFEKIQNLQKYRLLRALPADTIITPAYLKKRLMVKSGQIVTIENNSAYISIKMSGKALNNGAIGDTVKVKNLSSGKIIQAEVIKSGLVRAYP